jgi:hypothetical protein
VPDEPLRELLTNVQKLPQGRREKKSKIKSQKCGTSGPRRSSFLIFDF